MTPNSTTAATAIRPLLLPYGDTMPRLFCGVALRLICGVFALALSAKLTIPASPIPFSMQTFAVLVLGAAYGPKLGLATVMSYLALGTMGLPFFVMGGGPTYYLMPSAGYLFGFIPGVWLAGKMGERGWDRRFWSSIAGFALAHICIMASGTLWLKFFTGMSMEKALAVGLYPFYLAATVKFSAATLCMLAMWRIRRK